MRLLYSMEVRQQWRRRRLRLKRWRRRLRRRRRRRRRWRRRRRGEPRRPTRRLSVPPSHRRVRLRLRSLLRDAHLADSGLKCRAQTPWNQRRGNQSAKGMQLPYPVENPVQDLPAAAAPSAGFKSTSIISDLHDTRRLLVPRETSSTLNRNRRPEVRCGVRRLSSSATGNFCTTRRSRDRYR